MEHARSGVAVCSPLDTEFVNTKVLPEYTAMSGTELLVRLLLLYRRT